MIVYDTFSLLKSTQQSHAETLAHCKERSWKSVLPAGFLPEERRLIKQRGSGVASALTDSHGAAAASLNSRRHGERLAAGVRAASQGASNDETLGNHTVS